jgi:hypothetical protein
VHRHSLVDAVKGAIFVAANPTAQTLAGLIAATPVSPLTPMRGTPGEGRAITIQRVPFQCHARFLDVVLVKWTPTVHRSVPEAALRSSGPPSWEAGTPCGPGRVAASAQLVPFQWNAAGVNTWLPVWSDPTAVASEGEKLATPLNWNAGLVVTCCQRVPFQCSARFAVVPCCRLNTSPTAQPSVAESMLR